MTYQNIPHFYQYIMYLLIILQLYQVQLFQILGYKNYKITVEKRTLMFKTWP